MRIDVLEISVKAGAARKVLKSFADRIYAWKEVNATAVLLMNRIKGVGSQLENIVLVSK